MYLTWATIMNGLTSLNHCSVNHPDQETHVPSLYILNATSIAKPHAIDHLHADLLSNDVDIAIITETWLKTHHTDAQFTIPGYSIFRRDRLKRRGGGVAVYVRSGLDAELVKLDTPYERNIELLWVWVAVSGKVFIVGAVYHPPKPIYREPELIDAIEQSLDQFHASPDVDHVIIAGDFNQLSNETVQMLGLNTEFNEPTHAGHCLDRLYSSVPLYTNCKAIQATVSTAHKAVIARTDMVKIMNPGKQSKSCCFRRRSPGQHAQLLKCLGDLDWVNLLGMSDVQDAFDEFYKIIIDLCDSIYPVKTITVSNCDTIFVTPQIKAMLRQKNRLMHGGRILAANALATQIQRKIVAFNAARLSPSEVKRGSKELWKAVAQISGKSKKVDADYPVDADTLNQYFANISTDPKYLPLTPKLTVNKYTKFFTEQSVFRMLDTVKQTATGLDCIPSWFLRIAASFLSQPIAHFFNLSLSFSKVPVQWKSSSITPTNQLVSWNICKILIQCICINRIICINFLRFARYLRNRFPQFLAASLNFQFLKLCDWVKITFGS